MSFSTSSDRLYLKHISLLTIGFFVGIIAAYYFNLIDFDFSREIKKARGMGIVSITILQSYPKLIDMVGYLSVLGFPFICALIPWYLWSRNKKAELAAAVLGDNYHEPVSGNRGWVSILVPVVIFYAYASFDPYKFYAAVYNAYTGAWLLLGEDGGNLAWVQYIFNGGVYGKDFFCLYGPMLTYPLAGVMKVFGASVVVERYYRYFLDLIAYSIIILFLYKTLRWKGIFLLAAVAYFFVFPTFYNLSVNFTYLRFVLGMLPLLLLYIYLGNEKKYLLFLIGLVLGQSLLFSQETAVSSSIAVLATLFIHFLYRRGWQSFLRQCFLIAAGGMVSIAPIIMYLTWNGAFIPFIDSIYGFPRMASLGYGGLPAPAFKEFIASPLGMYIFYYWVILFYSFTAMYLASRLLLRAPNRDDLLKVAVLIFGSILFMVAVRRCSEENIHKVFHPAVLLLILFVDAALSEMLVRKNLARAGRVLLFAALIIMSIVLFYKNPYLAGMIGHSKGQISPDKWSRKLSGFTVPAVKRGGTFYDPATAESIMAIQNFLKRHTVSGDYVYFFPNEPAYYFLFDRNNPTRFAMSYFAITSVQRAELIADLEKRKTLYVVYSKTTWRVDGIGEDIQVPEVTQYIKSNYQPYLDLGSVVIMKRVSP